jgi:hypothetical protein
LKRPSLFPPRARGRERERHRKDIEAHKRMSAKEEDAADGRGGDGKNWHAKRDDGERDEEEEEEEGSRMDALPDEILETVLLATYTRDANPSAAAALVPLLFVCIRWYAIVRQHAVEGAKAMEWAVDEGPLALVEWLEDNGCPFDDRRLCDVAAAGGHLEVLRWAREQGCPWNERTCTAAAKGGHLEVLRWAREEGCPWNESTCGAAAGGGHLEVLR